MNILYVDDSGSVNDPTQRYFVLGAISVFERGIYHLLKTVDDCVAAFGLGVADDIELHATDIYGGRGQPWSSLKIRSAREALLHRALATIAEPAPAIRLFAVAVDKAGVSPRDPIEVAFEELCNRFNLFMARLRNRKQDDQRGLIVMDESKHEKPLQSLARKYRSTGGR